MRWFKDLKTMTKLMSEFALVGLIMAGVGYLDAADMAKINWMVGTLYQVSAAPARPPAKVIICDVHPAWLGRRPMRDF